MAFYILKINYDNHLRRLSLEKKELETHLFSFSYLKTRIRELLQLPVTSSLAITYTDDEKDVITMGSDQDLKDALVEQELSPLRIHVTLLKSKSDNTADEISPLVMEISHYVVQNPPVSPSLKDFGTNLTAEVKNGSAAATPSPYGTPTVSWNLQNVPTLRGTLQPRPHMQRPDSGDSPAGVGPSSTSEGVDSESQMFSTVHHGVTCDVCGLSPIVGNRWKSIVKFDYDLCSDCYVKNGNDKDYSKIEQPKFCPRYRNGPLRMDPPLLGPAGMMGPPPALSSMGTPPPFHPMSRHGQFHGGRPFGMRGPLGGFGGRHHYSPGFGSGEKLYARFVCDVTVFDGTEVSPGTHFVKIWRLRNSGTAPWPVNTSLVFVGGDELGNVTSVPLEIPEQGLAAEAEMEASVDMIAPEKPGRYVSHWRLASPAGPKFGQRLSVVIQVVPHASPVTYSMQTRYASVDCARNQELTSTLRFGSGPEAHSVERLKNSSPSTAQNDESGVVSTNPVDYARNQERRNPALLFMDGDANQRRELRMADILEDHLRPFLGVNPLPPAPTTTFRLDQKRARFQIPQPSQMANGSNAYPVSEATQDVRWITYPVSEATQDQGPITYPVSEATQDQGPITYPVSEATQDQGPITCPVPEATKDQGPITYPVVNPLMTGAAEPDVLNPAVPGDLEAEEGGDLTSIKREVLLRKLEVMGFSNSQLNYELLEKNGNDVRKTLDDLCIAEEWDPLLEELEEMGFYDTITNRRLMFKNNGSVKRVVKELVEMYRHGEGKSKNLE